MQECLELNVESELADIHDRTRQLVVKPLEFEIKMRLDVRGKHRVQKASRSGNIGDPAALKRDSLQAAFHIIDPTLQAAGITGVCALIRPG
tara:strand:- start:1215 stop:1487 length:273 start_codon:yes stop_codon:yes gene_type:complete